ncbi:translation initiation factor IF-2 [Candidatus Azambacteria bacterium]|nr:translation initiation factor IF-2 [Candidatus Azambacteria bacterium]MBI3684999.1 translation initiation factor IF-2 [Candidatus Azambacteria bacterium]
MNNAPASSSATTTRPPVVAVLGHIDHGKTTLLDCIRKSAVAAKESGGITQHVGAYEIAHALPDGTSKKITFLDTPGHEAFSKMRARGTKAADIAVLVVAADEGVKPQTLEALEHIAASGATLVVAINKIDKPDARPEKIKQQLAEKGILLEGWGGTVPNQELSAKTGKGVPELLSLLLLVAEVAELKADPSLQAQGIVIEARKNAQTGNSATLIILNGTLHQGEYIVAGDAIAKTRSITTSDQKTVPSATCSSPVVIIGFETTPVIGERFYAVKDKKSALALIETAQSKKETAAPSGAPAESEENKKLTLNVVLKADTTGTKEALEKIVNDMVFSAVAARVVKSGIGEVSENDVAFAQSARTIIVAFKVKVTASAAKAAQAHAVPVLFGETVYELADAIQQKLRELIPPEITRNDLGKLTVLATFKMDRIKMVVGGKVNDGKMKKGVKVDIKRKGALVFSGKISQLQHNKAAVTEVELGRECGMMIVPVAPQDAFIEVGDELVAYEEEMKQKALE